MSTAGIDIRAVIHVGMYLNNLQDDAVQHLEDLNDRLDRVMFDRNFDKGRAIH